MMMKFILGILVGFVAAVLFIRDRRIQSFADKSEGQPGSAEIELERRPSAPESDPAGRESLALEPDNLEEINGIGPVFAQRLNQAGIFTFEALSRQTPERLEEVVSAGRRQVIDTAAWIEQAKELAGRAD
jgi:predicted flap endonuclease-1-like 5' DNA nuclease